MTTPLKIPRGVWFDESRLKWRVRLYRNGRAYLPRPLAYFDSLEQAIEAYKVLRAEIEQIPKANPDAVTDLLSLWRQAVGVGGQHRIHLFIPKENV